MKADHRHQRDEISPEAAPSLARGRGSTINPTGRFERVSLSIDGEHLDAQVRENPEGSPLPTIVREDHARTIINRVDSPDLFFNWTINPYRGCEHGCVYCYARPSHEHLGLSPGLDFERVIFAKKDAASLLRAELSHPSWRAETIVLSGVTDPYQPVERELGITRSVLGVLAECRQPTSIITKNRLVLRDLDLLSELHAHGCVHAAVSITSLDNTLASTLEPRASSPRSRLEIVRALSDIGIPVTVMIAPVIPAINDHEIPRILGAAAEAGATNAAYMLLRLPHQNKAIYRSWLDAHYPDRAEKAESLLRQCREGELYRAEFGERFVGTGAIADQIRQAFRVFCRRHGLDRKTPAHNRGAFRAPRIDGKGQMALF